ncbi:MFS transporter [Leptospira vanthielii]|nr:MFS transporter [Leptospira vanthielii]
MVRQSGNTWNNIWKGIRLLFSNNTLRFALSIEFVSAIAGAMILVNTINHIKTGLQLDDKHYGWVMAAFGIGAAIAAFLAGSLDKSKTRAVSLILGVIALSLAITFTNFVSYTILMVLWLFAGLGQSLAEMPSETLIGENISYEDQGKVFGAHFAFSHLWWAITYPIAGAVGIAFPGKEFLYGGLLTIFATIITFLFFLQNARIGRLLFSFHK